MASFAGLNILSHGTTNFVKNGIYMESDAPQMLTLKMLEGTLDGLSDPHSILLSASAAKAIFGNRLASGNILKLGSKFDVKVTGVYADLPENTTFQTSNSSPPGNYMSPPPTGSEILRPIGTTIPSRLLPSLPIMPISPP
jgi:putative ABC transport system permease protein